MVIGVDRDRGALVSTRQPFAAHWRVDQESHQDPFLEHVRELLATDWRQAKKSADEEGRFATGLHISVLNGAPAERKLKCGISQTATDEIRSQVADSDQMTI
jgi:hypothetical protein